MLILHHDFETVFVWWQKNSLKIVCDIIQRGKHSWKRSFKNIEWPEAGRRWGREENNCKKKVTYWQQKKRNEESSYLSHPQVGISVHTDMKKHDFIILSNFLSRHGLFINFIENERVSSVKGVACGYICKEPLQTSANRKKISFIRKLLLLGKINLPLPMRTCTWSLSKEELLSLIAYLCAVNSFRIQWRHLITLRNSLRARNIYLLFYQ